MAATAPTIRRLAGAPAGAGAPARDGSPAHAASTRAGALVTAALLAVLLYAAFAHGAASQPEEARLQVAVSLLSVAALAALLWHPRLRVTAPPAGSAGLGLLAAFAAWSGLSLAWSLDPSATWTELNRAIAYVLVVALALAAGSWHRRAVWHAALGYAGIALLVALYALGGKVAPGVSVDGLVHLDQVSALGRLRVPLEYWNALGLFIAMALPVVLRLVVDETRALRVRLAALGALPLYLVTLGLTYSRGGVLAALVAVGVTVALAGARLRTLMYLALGAAASAPALAIGLTSDDLTGVAIPVAQREDDGLVLGLVLAASIVLLVAVGRLVLAAEARTPASPARSRAIGGALLGAAALALVAGVIAIAVSERGLAGTVSHEWDSFRSVKGEPGQFDPGRLASTNAGNRWVWWSEAVGAWSDRPLAGWGAGTFPVLHRQYRTNQLDVLQPHSVPLQFLAETGVVGLVLAGGGLLLLLAGAGWTVRRLVPGPERGMAAALLGAGVAWGVHCFYDWDWDIPGVTLPMLVFAGLLCARGARDRAARPAAGPGTAARAALLAAATLFLGTVAVSAALPSWAQSRTDRALSSVARDPTPAQLRRAQADADFAARIDPLSSQPLLAASSIAARRGREAQAREYLMDAIRRAPNRVTVWLAVARFEVGRGDARNVRTALRRALRLDPRNRIAPGLLAAEQYTSVPAGSSATATGTPLPAVVGQTPETGGTPQP
jgi:hypothetical protein